MDGAQLAPALAPTLEPLPTPPRDAIQKLAALGFRFVQLSALQPGLRPRDLDRSGRRDLVASLRRHGLAVSGIDFWIPGEHFLDAARVDRATMRTLETIELAEDLGRCPVSCLLPAPDDGTPDGESAALAALVAAGAQRGVPIADHAIPLSGRGDVGIDAAAWLATGDDPAAAVVRADARLASARVTDLLATGLRAPIGGAAPRLDTLAYKVALSVAHYERPVVVDARQWDDPWSGLKQTTDAW